jgi:hypothetical protein
MIIIILLLSSSLSLLMMMAMTFMVMKVNIVGCTTVAKQRQRDGRKYQGRFWASAG